MTKATDKYTALDAIGAIELAMAAGADARARNAVIREILKRAPTPGAGATAPVRLLMEAVRAANAEFRVTDHEPRGRIGRTQNVARRGATPGAS